MKKIISLMVSVCMVFTLIPMISFADQTDAQQAPDVEVQAQQEADLVQEGEEVEMAGQDAEGQDVESIPDELVIESQDTVKWVQTQDGNWQAYVGSNYLTGWQLIAGATYYFATPSGYMQVGQQKISGNDYYFDTTNGSPAVTARGQMKKDYWLKLNGGKDKYYYGSDGVMVKGQFITINGKTYYLDPGTGRQHRGWLTLGKDKYYTDTDSGVLKKGWLKLNNAKYYMDAGSGRMHTGWVKLSNGTFYCDLNTGKQKTGWQTINKAKYYFNPDNGKMKTGWQTIKKAKYYFNPDNGKMKTGMMTLNGSRYLLNAKSGKMMTGWQTYKKNRYYFDTKSGKAKTGLVTISKRKYYFAGTGVMQSGLIKIKGVLYYFQVSGKYKGSAIGKGWFTADLDRKTRYSYGNGKLAVGTVSIGGYYYQFSTSNGALLKKLGDAIDRKVQSESSRTGHLIYVSKSKHQVRVYSGSKNNWSRKYSFTCATGGSRTTSGKFTLNGGSREQVHPFNDPATGTPVRFWFVYKYNGSQGFNSIIYRQDNGAVFDGRLGGNYTNGSIRLSYNNARYIYNSIGSGTKVWVQ